MKPSSPELRALLSTRQFFAADLWTFTLTGGTVLRYSSGDADIIANGKTYRAGGLIGPYFDRQDSKAKCHWKVGTGADSLLVDVLPGSAQILGDPMLDAIRKGIFDGAACMLERAYMPTYGDTRAGVIRNFLGRVAQIDAGASLATFSINSQTELLNLQLPRNIAQISCMNNLGDATCTVNLEAYKVAGTVSGVTDKSNFSASLASSPAAGTFDGGKVKFTSGGLSGYSATVKTCVIGGTSTIALLGFLPSLPGIGDSFDIYYGCDKSVVSSNGCPKFANTPHFRGFPFIPQPSVAV